jgi:hypothetical protein
MAVSDSSRQRPKNNSCWSWIRTALGVAVTVGDLCAAGRPLQDPSQNAAGRDVQPASATEIRRKACQLTAAERRNNISFVNDAVAYAIYAVLSNNAYAGGAQFSLTSDWRRVELFETVGTDTGLALALFEHVVAGKPVEVVIAFRGTDERRDWVQNLVPFFRRQIVPAERNFERIREKYKASDVRFVATGHSLGGGLALHLSFRYPDVSAIVFNASPVAKPGPNPLPNARVNIWETKEILSSVRKIARFRWPRTKQVTFEFEPGYGIEKALAKHGIYSFALNMLRLASEAPGAPDDIRLLFHANCRN